MTLLGSVVDVLHTHGTPFALIGAGAMVVHGINRATTDLDLLVVEPRCLETSYWSRLSPSAAQVSIRRGDGDDPLAGVVRVQSGAEGPLDVVVGKAAWQAAAVAAAVPVDIEGIEMPVVRRIDLVLLKLYAGGPQDAWDIEQLLESASRGALVAEVDARISELPDASRALWRRIRNS